MEFAYPANLFDFQTIPSDGVHDLTSFVNLQRLGIESCDHAVRSAFEEHAVLRNMNERKRRCQDQIAMSH